MIGIFRKDSSKIIMQSVRMGNQTVDIPVVRIQGKADGRTLLVTAGNDGDEYSGIEACYQIIDEFSSKDFAGELICIPVVNMPGFLAETSKNPLDDTFPKFVYPGKEQGSPTEQLRYWLSGYVNIANAWLDLHGGSLVESLVPFIWGWQTGITQVDTIVQTVIAQGKTPYGVWHTPWDRITNIGRNNCSYILSESGMGGRNDKQAVDTQYQITRVVMNALEMKQYNVERNEKIIYSHVSEYQLKRSGLWFSEITAGQTVEKGQIIGRVRALNGKDVEVVRATQSGVSLWQKQGLRAGRGDIVAGVGSKTIEYSNI
jgi:predicted deacylase